MYCIKCAAEIPDSDTSHLCTVCATEAGGKRQLSWRAWWGSFFICCAAVLFIVFLIAIFSDSNSQPDSSNSQQPSAPQTASSDSKSQPDSSSSQPDTNIQAPKDESESKFVSTLNSFVARYRTAPNEFKKSDLRRERAKAIAIILPNLSIQTGSAKSRLWQLIQMGMALWM